MPSTDVLKVVLISSMLTVPAELLANEVFDGKPVGTGVGVYVFSKIQVIGLTDDVHLSFGAPKKSIPICVAINTQGNLYKVMATAYGGSFKLLSGAKHIPYTVAWGGNNLLYGVSTNDILAIDVNCATTTNTKLTISANDLSSMHGNYVSRLNLKISPVYAINIGNNDS